MAKTYSGWVWEKNNFGNITYLLMVRNVYLHAMIICQGPESFAKWYTGMLSELDNSFCSQFWINDIFSTVKYRRQCPGSWAIMTFETITVCSHGDRNYLQALLQCFTELHRRIIQPISIYKFMTVNVEVWIYGFSAFLLCLTGKDLKFNEAIKTKYVPLAIGFQSLKVCRAW